MRLHNVVIGLVILALAAGVYYVYTQDNTLQGTQTATGISQVHTTPMPASSPPNHGTGSTQPTTYTTTTGETEEITIWDLTPEYSLLRLTHTAPLNSYPPPVLVNGTFYDFSYARFSYTYRIMNETIAFNVTWSMEGTSYTGVCHDFITGEDISRTDPDALKITYSYNFMDGFWFQATMYLPHNSTMIDFLNLLPIRDFEIATPHGSQYFLLGAEFHSNNPGSNGYWTSSQPLLPEEQATKCLPITHGSPEAYSFLEEASLLFDHDAALMFMPFEINSPNGILSEVNKTIEAVGSTISYDMYYYRVTPIGRLEYPGTGLNLTVYNLTFWTEPDYVHGYYLITAESIVPLEYHAVFPQGDKMDGIPVTVTFRLLDSAITPYPWKSG